MEQNILIRDPSTGMYQIDSRLIEYDYKMMYKELFYSQEKPEYLNKVRKELSYWHKIWTIRLDLMEASLKKPGTILDIGAGGGFFLALARDRGWKIHGIEPSIKAVSYAKNEFGIKLVSEFFESVSTVENEYDAIHIAFVLEHVLEPKKFINKVLSTMKNNSVLWVEVPNDNNPLQFVITTQMNKKSWWIVPEHHLNYFDYNSLSKLLCRKGVDELERMASFPIELFALMGMDYIANTEIGKSVHYMRMKLENNIISYDPNLLVSLYRSLAAINLGRSCNIMVHKC